MKINAYLNFDGQCEAAFKFYQTCFGGEITNMMTHQGAPTSEHVPADWQDKILHARLETEDWVLMGSDSPPGQFEKAAGLTIFLQIDDLGEAERVFHALQEKGIVIMPFGQTFWATRYGELRDQFGIPWMINCN